MQSLRVLFVDDEEELVSTVVERLEIRGIEAIGATSGAQAIRFIEDPSINVVVLDVKMPSLGGFDVIRKIKQERPELTVIFLTGHGSEEIADEGLRLGAYDYIMKPVDIDVLVGILQRAANA